MSEDPTYGSLSFKLVAKGLVELHRLIKDGKEDSSDADSIRDGIDAHLAALSPHDKEQARWLSEDLFAVSEAATATSLKATTAEVQKRLYEAYEARQNGQWGRALEMLRKYQDYVAPALLSYLRGSVWLEAGIPEVAAMFYGHASENDKDNANYKAIYLHALANSDSDTAGRLVARILAGPDNEAPVVVARAADIRFNETKMSSDAVFTQTCRDLLPILERNLARVENDTTAASRESTYAMTVALLGFCHEGLGNTPAAAHYYSRGLQVNPNNDGLLVARGILLYGKSARAIDDLERAVQIGSPVIWPYFFLAHHYLATNQFDQCRIVCEMGLRKSGSDNVKSQLEEWRAIALAELGFPPDAVRAAFETAVRLDPSNEFATRNQDSFEASIAAPHARPQSKWEQLSKAVIRQIGLTGRRYSSAA